MSVEKTVFGTLSDGREAALYTLKNAAGMTLVVTPYGCRIIQLLVPDKDGKLGDVVLGHRTLEEYFPSKLLQREVNSPIVLLKLEGKFDAIVLVDGGGTTGQAGAIRLGVARALNAIDRDANRAALKKAGFLTRDARVVERKKAGLHKARRAPQFSKR